MVQLFFGLFAIFYLSHTATASDLICRTDKPCSVKHKTIGCFKDDGDNRVLPHYIYNERDASRTDNYGNRNIEWNNWEKYMAGFSCRCAQRAKQLGYDLIGVQFYGECWAARTADVSISSLVSEGAVCVGDNYKPCGGSSRYCAGVEYSNFVYQLVDTTCSIEFVKEGCYADDHNDNSRPLGNYVLNDRDLTTASYSGRNIDWINWDLYVSDLACRCAQKAQQNGSTYFGLQYYGECWAHPTGSDTYGRDGSEDNCVDNCYKSCNNKPFCTGVQFSNYVYRIKGQESCDANIVPVGCYTENPKSRVLRQEIVNANIPSYTPVFYGKMATVGDWGGFFTDFLCKCASEAKIKKQAFFGVTENGVCYTDNVSTNYATLGSSSSCYEGRVERPCASGSKACAGINPTATYVYKVTAQ